MSKICNNFVPFQKFKEWLEKAEYDKKIIEPTAMCLSTVGQDNKPSSRMVLLKKYNEKGFCFFTNLNSRKGKDLSINPNVALCFYWGLLGLQIRIEGSIEKLTQKEADDYFNSRRRGSQIGAWASKQSHEMECWSDFEKRLDEVSQEFDGLHIPRPPFWNGFRVVPKVIEFWQEGEFRIHKREVYSKLANDGWEIRMLYP